MGSNATHLAALEPGHEETSDGVQRSEFPPGMTHTVKIRSAQNALKGSPLEPFAAFQEPLAPFGGTFPRVVNLDRQLWSGGDGVRLGRDRSPDRGSVQAGGEVLVQAAELLSRDQLQVSFFTSLHFRGRSLWIPQNLNLFFSQILTGL